MNGFFSSGFIGVRSQACRSREWKKLDMMIYMSEVTKSYANGTYALFRVDLSVYRGEFVFLVGPSGSGKTTIIRLLMREEFPDEGRIFIDNQDILNLDRRGIARLRRRTGVVFQDFKLLPRRTVYENVAFALEVTDASPRQIKKLVPEALALVGLEEKGKLFPEELSGGEKQRVSIARAIVNDPPLLLADEPTGNLDPGASQDLMGLLESINRRGTTVLMVTHDREVVNRYQKRVVYLEEGMIISDEQEGVYGHAT